VGFWPIINYKYYYSVHKLQISLHSLTEHLITPVMARFARHYGAYELNQCKLKARAYDMRMKRA
jgi:hypothetical protein